MAERAHPEDPAFQGTVYERALQERHSFGRRFVPVKPTEIAACRSAGLL
jgi:hypothetical protein